MGNDDECRRYCICNFIIGYLHQTTTTTTSTTTTTTTTTRITTLAITT